MNETSGRRAVCIKINNCIRQPCKKPWSRKDMTIWARKGRNKPTAAEAVPSSRPFGLPRHDPTPSRVSSNGHFDSVGRPVAFGDVGTGSGYFGVIFRAFMLLLRCGRSGFTRAFSSAIWNFRTEGNPCSVELQESHVFDRLVTADLKSGQVVWPCKQNRLDRRSIQSTESYSIARSDGRL